jgi:hypothetical protein
MIAIHFAAVISIILITGIFAACFMLYLPRMCKHKVTIKLSSIQKQKCADCYAWLDWPLKDGQQPLISSSRDRRRK